jgi:hypothetical protein
MQICLTKFKDSAKQWHTKHRDTGLEKGKECNPFLFPVGERNAGREREKTLEAPQ